MALFHNQRIRIAFLGTVLLLVAVVFLRGVSRRADIPRGETTPEQESTRDGSVTDTSVVRMENNTSETQTPDTDSRLANRTAPSTREILVTDGVSHSIPLAEILQGCPRKDCIPSIDTPKYETITEATEWLDDAAPGIAFSRGNTHRFYPYDILVSHEIVNDTVEGERVLISYCPLCLTAVVYDPLVQGERVEFGVSGLLWESNLIMYDRKSETFWSQVLGEAIMGELTGTKLTLLPSDQVLFSNWKKAHPNGEVLGREFLRGLGSGNPYAKTHFDVSGTALSFAKPTDERLPFGTHVFGVIINGNAKAYPVDAIRNAGVVIDVFEGKTIVLRYVAELDTVRMFESLPDGTEIRINPLSGFWFSWVGAHPETAIYEE